MDNFIKTIKVSYYRSYQDQQSLKLSIHTGKLGSGLTVLVGANNAGKTTLLEALLLDRTKKIADHERVMGCEPVVEYFGYNGTTEKLSTVRTNSAQLTGEVPGIEIVPSRRAWNSKDNSMSTASETIRTSRSLNIRGGSNFSVGSILKEIDREVDKAANFTAYLQRIFPDFTEWSISNDGDNDYISYRTKSNTRHRTDFLGDGVASVFRILSHLLYGNKQIPLIIDEPELSLQPEAQKKLAQIVSECAMVRQIILATHSTYFVRLADFKNGATYARINKHGDVKSTISQLKPFAAYESLFAGDGWHMPFVFDEVAKEIFFQDSILFVEGQYDVGLMEKYFEENARTMNFNLFGYGVRGCRNFRFALELAKDLGLQKVAVLIDKGDEEDLIVAQLKATFEVLIQGIGSFSSKKQISLTSQVVLDATTPTAKSVRGIEKAKKGISMRKGN